MFLSQHLLNINIMRENCMIFYLIYMVNFIWIHSRPSFLNLQNHILVAIPWQTISLSFISLVSLYMIFHWFSTWATMNSPDKERHSIHTFINYIDNAQNISFRFLCYVPLLLHASMYVLCWTMPIYSFHSNELLLFAIHWNGFSSSFFVE